MASQIGGKNQEEAQEPEEQRRVYSPFGRTDTTEHKTRSLQLLAKYALGWELQKKGREQSVMNMDYQWREKQRQKAMIDLKDKNVQPETNWMQSLRGNEQFQSQERRIGRENPIVFMLPPERVNAALKAVAEQPEYKPVAERLPSRLRRRNQEYLERLAEERIGKSQQYDEEALELPLMDEVPLERLEQWSDEPGVLRGEGDGECDANNEQEAIAPDQIDQLAMEIIRQPSAAVPVRLQEAHYSASSQLFPYLQIDSLTAISSASYANSVSAVITLLNLGDTVLNISLFPLESNQQTIQAPSMVPPSAPVTSTIAGRQIPAPDSPKKLQTPMTPKTPMQQPPPLDNSHQETPNSIAHALLKKLPRSPEVITSRYAEKTNLQMTASRQTQSTFSPHPQSHGNATTTLFPEATADEINARALIEKAATPAPLKILAGRCIQQDRGDVQSRVLVASPGKEWRCAVGEQQQIRFLLPQKKQAAQPGIILQEYALAIKPPCAVHFKNPDDARAGAMAIRSYGINSQCLQLAKQLSQEAAVGQRFLDQVMVQQLSRSLFDSLADQCVDVSERQRGASTAQAKERQRFERFVEQETIAAFETQRVRAKYIQNQEERRDFIYGLLDEVRLFHFQERFGLEDDVFIRPGQLAQTDLTQAQANYIRENIPHYDRQTALQAQILLRRARIDADPRNLYALTGTKRQQAAALKPRENHLSRKIIIRLLDDFLLHVKRQTRAPSIGYDGDIATLAFLLCCFTEKETVLHIAPLQPASAPADQNPGEKTALDAECEALGLLLFVEQLYNAKPEDVPPPKNKPVVNAREAAAKLQQQIRQQFSVKQDAEKAAETISFDKDAARHCESVLHHVTVLQETWEKAEPFMRQYFHARLVKEFREEALREKARRDAFLRFYSSRDPLDLTPEDPTALLYERVHVPETLESDPRQKKPQRAAQEPSAPEPEAKKALSFQELLQQTILAPQKKAPTIRLPDAPDAIHPYKDCVASHPQLAKLQARDKRFTLAGSALAKQLLEPPALRELIIDAVQVAAQLEAFPAEVFDSLVPGELGADAVSKARARALEEQKAVCHQVMHSAGTPALDRKEKKRAPSIPPGAEKSAVPPPPAQAQAEEHLEIATAPQTFVPFEELFHANIADVQHSLRLACMRREFDAFIDAIFDPQTEQTVKLHEEQTATYLEEKAIFDDGGADAIEEPHPPKLEEEFGIAEPENEQYLFDYCLHVTQLEGVRKSAAGFFALVKQQVHQNADYSQALDKIIEKVNAARQEDLVRIIEALLGVRLEFTAVADPPIVHQMQTQLNSAKKLLSPSVFHALSSRQMLTAPGAIFDVSKEMGTADGTFAFLPAQSIPEPQFLQHLQAQVTELLKSEMKGASKLESQSSGKADQGPHAQDKDKPEIPLRHSYSLKSMRSAEPKHSAGASNELFEDEENLPPYLKPVDDSVQARRDVYSWLFEMALERAANWFEAVDRCSESLLMRAGNYIQRGVMNVYK